jgi:hypothetical protein
MANVTLAANERAFSDLIKATAKKLELTPPLTGNGSFGPFTASYELGFKLTGGSIELTPAGTVHIKELDITYDPLVLRLGIDLPHIQIGGECILRIAGKCIIRLPRIDIFGDNPDIEIPINLSGLVTSEFSGEFSVSTGKQVLQAKGSRSDHQAHFDADTSDEIRDRFRTRIGMIPLLPGSAVNAIADTFVPFVKGNLADKWQFFLRDVWHDLDIIDIASTAENILRNLTDYIIDQILAPIPAALREIAHAILDPVISAIGFVLDIGDDVVEWLSSLFQTSFGLLDLLAQLIVNFLGSLVPFFQFETPYPAIVDNSGLIPVLVPVENLAITVNDDEFTVACDLL